MQMQMREHPGPPTAHTGIMRSGNSDADDAGDKALVHQVQNMQRKMDELMMQHSESLDAKNAQIIKAVKQCQVPRLTRRCIRPRHNRCNNAPLRSRRCYHHHHHLCHCTRNQQ